MINDNEIDKYVQGIIVNEGHSIKMNKGFKKEYLSILNNCKFMQENCCSVSQMFFKSEKNLVSFNGNITDGNRIVKINGIINTTRKSVETNVHWQNTDDSMPYEDKYDGENTKGRKR